LNIQRKILVIVILIAEKPIAIEFKLVAIYLFIFMLTLLIFFSGILINWRVQIFVNFFSCHNVIPVTYASVA